MNDFSETTSAPLSREEASSPKTQRSELLRSIKCVGTVGLGQMGQFAQTLLPSGLEIVVYDRNLRHTETLQLDGAIAVGSVAELSSCDVVITSLPDDAELTSVALAPKGLASILALGAIHVSLSTVSTELSRRLAAAHVANGQSCVAASVLVNPDLARSQRLFILASGQPEAIEHVRPVLERLGQRVFFIGDDAGLANVMQLAGNVLTAAILQSMGEVFALLRKAGIYQRLAFEVLTGSLFDGRVHKAYGGKIVGERYDPPGMTTPMAVKDLRLALAEAETLAVPMPVAGMVHDRLVTMVARGWSGLDWSALGLLAACDAGLNSVAFENHR